MERGKEREEAWSFDGVSEGKRTAAKGCEENKENLIVNSELKDDLLVYQDEEALNDSVISGEERPEPAARGRGATWEGRGQGLPRGWRGAPVRIRREGQALGGAERARSVSVTARAFSCAFENT